MERSDGPAGPFHQREPDSDVGHELWVRTLPAPALILGSTQPDALVRADRALADGIEVTRRRSGGGLVHIDPATDAWVDAIVPAGSPLWSDDVGRAFHWLGHAWARAIDQSGPGGPSSLVHRPGPGHPRQRPLWCFAGLGHGEVTMAGSKIVGLSQRRTRSWIRLQSLVLGAWPGRRLLPYLDLEVARSLVTDHDEAGPDTGSIPPPVDPDRVRAGPPTGRSLPQPPALVEALLTHLAPGSEH